MNTPTALLISGCLGALIGLVRQWSEQQEGHDDAAFAGLRTFALLALLGHLAGLGSTELSPALLPVTLGVIGLYATFAGGSGRPIPVVGYSTFTASLLTVFIGAMVHWQYVQEAIIITVITSVLLAFKRTIHGWTQRFTTEDIRSALQFAAITGVILPLVPNQGYGPYEALNPRNIWLMVVLISGLGFVGYVLMRFLGAKAGITLTGLVGGLASSTATTLAFSRRSKDTPDLSHAFALAVILACTVMLIRVAAMLLAVNPALFQRLLVPLLIMSVPGAAYAVWAVFLRGNAEQTVKTPEISNPLGLKLAIKFALIYGLISLLVKAAADLGASEGLMLVSAISGLTDVDAITLAMAQNAQQQAVPVGTAAQAVLVGAMSNTVMKAGLALSLGSPQLRKIIAVVLGLTVLAGGLALLFVRAG